MTAREQGSRTVKLTLKHAVAAIFLLMLSVAAPLSDAIGQVSPSERMNFTGVAPDPVMAKISGTAWIISATGLINSDAGKRFEQFLITNHVPILSFVNFDSLGGSPIGAMALGRVIRKYRLRTDIAKRDANGKFQPGVCFSACALAFLGGEFRYRSKGSRYGVHRFSFSSSTTENSDIAQILSAAEVEYIRSMGVDPTLWTLSAATSAQEIFEPTKQQLLELGVLNNGRSLAKWSIESSSLGLYLKGEQNTEFGINKFMIVCGAHGQLMLAIIFDPQGRQDQAVRFRADSLIIDGHAYTLKDVLVDKRVVNGLLNALYQLPETNVALIQSAHTVGVTTQLAYEAPIFLGFNAMPFKDGAAKLPGFLKTCRGH